MKIEIFVRLEATRFVDVEDDSAVANAVRELEKEHVTDEDIARADAACAVISEWRMENDVPISEWDRVDVDDEFVIEAGTQKG